MRKRTEEIADASFHILARRAIFNLGPICYKKLAEEINRLYPWLKVHWRSLRKPLDLVQEYCHELNAPNLTFLVVYKDTGIPGIGCEEKFLSLNPNEQLRGIELLQSQMRAIKDFKAWRLLINYRNRAN